MKILAIVALVGVGGMAAWWWMNQTPATQDMPPVEIVADPVVEQQPAVEDAATAIVSETPQDATYSIEQQQVTLVAGSASTPIPNSSATTDTTLFGEPVFGSLTPANNQDAGVMLIQQTGGSGSFFYVAASLQVEGGYQGTNAILLGDRISPQTMEIRDQMLIVNYAEVAAGDPETAQPSQAVSKYFQVNKGMLVEIAPPAM